MKKNTLAWVFLGLSLIFALMSMMPSGSCPTGCAWVQWPWDLAACQVNVALCPIVGAIGFWIPLVLSIAFMFGAIVYKFLR